MKAVHTLLVSGVLFAGFGVSEEAEARRSKRSGFNFGTTVRLIDTNDRSIAGEGSDKNTRLDESSQQVNPYVGYAFGALNLGLSLTFEQSSSALLERSEDGTLERTRDTSSSAKGASLFSRFNFGEVFFFEGAAGLYEQKTEVEVETKNFTGEGAFAGETDAYTVKGVGPGYSLGMGLEFQMGGGFYFTSAYQVRMVQLRDYKGGSDLGAKRSFEQKRELLFGIAHYTR